MVNGASVIFERSIGTPEIGTAIGVLATSIIVAAFGVMTAGRLLRLGERTGALGASLASFGLVMLSSALVFRAIGLVFAWYLSANPLLLLASAILLIAGFVGEALGAATLTVGILYATGYTRLAGIWMLVAVFASLVSTIYAALRGSFVYFIAINTVVEAPSFLAAASPFHESWRRGNEVDQQAFFGFMLGAIAPIAASIVAAFGVAPAILVSNIILLLALLYVASWSSQVLRAAGA